MGTPKKKVNWLVLSIAALILFSFLIFAVSSNFFTVRIKEIKVLGGDGLTYSVDAYVPDTATNENPAPLVIWQFGGGTEGDFAATWGVELARRGYVVVLSDGVAVSAESCLLSPLPAAKTDTLIVQTITSVSSNDKIFFIFLMLFSPFLSTMLICYLLS